MYSETDFRGLFMKIQINQFYWTSLFLLSFSVPLLSFCFVFLSTNLTALSSFRTSFAFWRKKTDQTIFNKIIYQMLSYCLSSATKYPKNHFPFHWRYRCTNSLSFLLYHFCRSHNQQRIIQGLTSVGMISFYWPTGRAGWEGHNVRTERNENRAV